MATYEFVIEERTRYVVLGDGENPNQAKEDAMLRLLRELKSSDGQAPISYKLVVVKAGRHDNKRTDKPVKQDY